MIICVAATTKSMTTNKIKNEIFLPEKLLEIIAFLSKKIVSLSDDLNANTLFSIISTANIIPEFERIELEYSETRRIQFLILNALLVYKDALTLTEISKRAFCSKCSAARVLPKFIREDPATRETIDSDRRAENMTVMRKDTAFIEETMPNRLKMTDEVMVCLTWNHMVLLTG